LAIPNATKLIVEEIVALIPAPVRTPDESILTEVVSA
jgi:hypothetical protein